MPFPINWKLKPVGGPNLQRTGTGRSPKGIGPWQHGAYPMQTTPPLYVTGVTRDSTGAPLGACEVELYRRAPDGDSSFGVFVARTISDGSGNFSFLVAPGALYQHIAYQVGSPDKAGVSARTIVGA